MCCNYTVCISASTESTVTIKEHCELKFEPPPPPIISICISKTHKRTRKVRKQFRFIQWASPILTYFRRPCVLDRIKYTALLRVNDARHKRQMDRVHICAIKVIKPSNLVYWCIWCSCKCSHRWFHFLKGSNTASATFRIPPNSSESRSTEFSC